MTRSVTTLEVRIDELWLDLDALCQATGAEAAWVRRRVDEGLLRLGLGDRFDAAAATRVRRLLRLERDFGAAPELAALVADLEDEIARLRARLAAHGLT